MSLITFLILANLLLQKLSLTCIPLSVYPSVQAGDPLDSFRSGWRNRFKKVDFFPPQNSLSCVSSFTFTHVSWGPNPYRTISALQHHLTPLPFHHGHLLSSPNSSPTSPFLQYLPISYGHCDEGEGGEVNSGTRGEGSASSSVQYLILD